jgi:hypothetical protein
MRDASLRDPVQRLMVKFLNDPKISATTSMPVGSAGGTAECTTDSAFKNGLDCGWVNGTTALTLSGRWHWAGTAPTLWASPWAA